MLKLNDLKGLSKDAIISQANIDYDALVFTLISEGLLNRSKAMLYKGVDCTKDMYYSIDKEKGLICELNGILTKHHIVNVYYSPYNEEYNYSFVTVFEQDGELYYNYIRCIDISDDSVGYIGDITKL